MVLLETVLKLSCQCLCFTQPNTAMAQRAGMCHGRTPDPVPAAAVEACGGRAEDWEDTAAVGTTTSSPEGETSDQGSTSKRVKRPMNAFMVWSSEQRKIMAKANPEKHNSAISSDLGKIWRNEMSDEQKEPSIQKAKDLREEHLKNHPGYKYKPKRKKTVKKEKPSMNDVQSAQAFWHGCKAEAALHPEECRCWQCQMTRPGQLMGVPFDSRPFNHLPTDLRVRAAAAAAVAAAAVTSAPSTMHQDAQMPTYTGCFAPANATTNAWPMPYPAQGVATSHSRGMSTGPALTQSPFTSASSAHSSLPSQFPPVSSASSNMVTDVHWFAPSSLGQCFPEPPVDPLFQAYLESNGSAQSTSILTDPLMATTLAGPPPNVSLPLASSGHWGSASIPSS